MQGSSVLSIAPLDLFVKLPDILKTWQDYRSAESVPQFISQYTHGEYTSTVLPRGVHLDQHEVVEAAVHHQPQWAGRHLSARTFPDILGFSSLLLLRMILPLQPTLLLPVLSSLPAAQNTGQILQMWAMIRHNAGVCSVVKYLKNTSYLLVESIHCWFWLFHGISLIR